MVLAIWLTFYRILSIFKKFTVLTSAKLGLCYLPGEEESQVLCLVELTSYNALCPQRRRLHVGVFEESVFNPS